MALSDLLSVGCDVELKLDDCTMPASSVVLRLMSGVFSNALDADCHTPTKQVFGRSTSPSASKTTNIPLPGVSNEQWLRIAEFLYPVVPSPKIKDWAEAEYLLEVGKKFDLRLLLHKVDLYLDSRAPEMYSHVPTGERNYWKWFKLADGASLTVCLPAIAKTIAKQHKASCALDENLQGLSSAAYQALVKTLVT